MLSLLQRRSHELEILRAGREVGGVRLKLLADLLELGSVGGDGLLRLLSVLPRLGLLDLGLSDLLVRKVD